MNFLRDHLLTALVFLPLVGALIALAFPRGEHTGVRGFAMAVCLADLGLAIASWVRFDPLGGMQLEERAAWIDSLGIQYAVGIDGIALLMVLLTTFLAPLVILSTYSSIADKTREYMVCVLLLQTCMLGGFVACDMFLFYTFWEAMLVPCYFLIGVWGGRRRVAAALKFFLYTMTGSLLMLVAILSTVWAVRDGQGHTSFLWVDVAERLAHTELGSLEVWLFLAFALAFGIKVPLFPFHTWLPDAYAESPTPATVILSGVLVKLGVFGFLRYALWLFPNVAAAFLPTLGILSVIGIIYGALVAMVQSDIKRVIAYSSVSHLGFVMLGVVAMTVTGLSGSVLQMLNHGVATGALFLLVGVISERRHSRELADMGGLAHVMPMYAAIFVIMSLSSIGLPGLAGFVGEFMILLGTFSSEGLAISATTQTVAHIGMMCGACVALVALGILAINLTRQRVQGLAGNLGGGCVWLLGAALALGLCAPPLGGFAGGLLLRPLRLVEASTLPFHEIYALLAVVASLGVVLSAVYMLQVIGRVFFGPLRHAENEHLLDLSVRERFMFLPLVALSFVIGLHPQPFLNVVLPTAERYTAQFRLRAGMPPQIDHALVGDPKERAGVLPVLHEARGEAHAAGAPTGNPLQELVPLRRVTQGRHP